MAALRDRRAPALLLLAALLLSALAFLYWTRGSTFYADDWNFIVDRRGWDLHTLLLPSNGHLIVLPLLVFKTQLEIFGADSALPLKLIVLFFFLLDGVLVYLLASRRLGPLWALVPTVLILFLGAGWEEFVSTFGLDSLVSIAAGLGMLLCLDRRDLAGDVGACALLLASLASFSLGVVFGVIAAIELLQRPGYGLRRAWVYAGPALLYVIWLIWAQKYHQGQLAATNLGPTPSAIADAAGAVSAAIFGVFRSPAVANPAAPDLGIRTDWGIPIALILVAALALRIHSGPPLTPRAWALIVAILVYWTLLGLTIGLARSPLASRYVFVGVLLVLLLAVELVVGLRMTRGWGIAVLAVLAFSLVANVDTIRVAGGYFRAESSYNRAELAALQLVRRHVPSDFLIESGSTALLPHGDIIVTAGNYFSAIDEYGSPAYSLRELAAAGPAQRDAADQMLGRALGLSLIAPDQLTELAGTRIVQPAGAASQMTVARRGRCVKLIPAAGHDGRAVMRLPPGGFQYATARDNRVSVALARFGPGFVVKPAPLIGSAALQIPGDGSARPWRGLFRSSEPLLVCAA